MLKFLGVGSCFNTDMGNTSAYYIEDNKLTLIDCGESAFESIVNRRLLDGIRKVDIYITHWVKKDACYRQMNQICG